MVQKVALITGINGQDGSYLADLLIDKGYQVWGIVRRASSINTTRINHIYPKLKLAYGDMSDTSNMVHLLERIRTGNPDMERLEIYNFAAMSHVKVSFEMPEYTGNIDGLGVLRLLEAVRILGLTPIARIYQASTSEMYGKVQEVPQTETTPFYPRSPYGSAKLYAYWISRNYRESYGMYVCNGILFNHESPRRGPTFVTRKITIGLGNILSGKQSQLVLGNLDAKRDWGHARDYVEGAWRMLQQKEAQDYVLATNSFHSVREFVTKAFALVGITLRWEGSGLDEKGICEANEVSILPGTTLITVDTRYFRPNEVDELLGSSEKAKKELGWEPTTSFDELVQEMVDQDCA